VTDGDRRRTALVTGASSGLGLELARCFARDGFDVALVARTEPALRALADVLSERHGVQTHVLPLDLSEDAAPDAVMAELASRGVTVDALVNSAGFTQFGPLAETDERTLDELVHVNVGALTRFTRLVLPGMLERGWGRIVNLASNAAFQPGPLMASYFASKAYVLSFSIAVNEEVRGSGVTVTALCPGPTASGFQVRGEMVESKLVVGRNLPSAEKVARWGFGVAMRGKPYAVHGVTWKAFAFATRFMPRTTAARLVMQGQAPVGR
jgi:short-subunit dehydrogenase